MATKAKFKLYNGTEWVEYDFGGSAPSNMVTTNTSQTISGLKKFSNGLEVDSNNYFGSIKCNSYGTYSWTDMTVCFGDDDETDDYGIYLDSLNDNSSTGHRYTYLKTSSAATTKDTAPVITLPSKTGTLALTSDISWNNITVNNNLELVPNTHSNADDWEDNGIIRTRAYGNVIRLQYSYKEDEYPSGYAGYYDNKIELSPGYYGPKIRFTDCRDKPGYADLMAGEFNFIGHSGYNSRCDFSVNGSSAITYAHHVHIWNNSSTRYSISFILFTNSKDPITTFANLRNYIYYGKTQSNSSYYHNTINRSVSAHGFYNSYTNIVTGIYAAASGSGNVTIRYQPYNGNETSVSLSSFTNIADSVDQLLGGWY